MGEINENIGDNDSEHNEILNVAITYKTDGTYPTNSSKDRKSFYVQSVHPLKTLSCN